MRLLQKILFVLNILLLIWLFMVHIPEYDLARIKNQSFFRGQISEIENNNSVEELKNIAKSKVFQIKRIHQINDEKDKNQFYVITFIISLQIFLVFNSKKINRK